MRITQTLVSIASLWFLLCLMACSPSPVVSDVPPTATFEPAVQTAEAKLTVAGPQSTRAAQSAPVVPPPLATSAPAGNILKRWNAQQVASAFHDAGLDFGQPTRMTPKDYGLTPLLCAGTHFYIPSLCSDCGGRVYECDTVDDRDRLVKFYQEVAKGSAILFSWVYARDNIVVQLNGDLPEATAKKYQTSLEALR